MADQNADDLRRHLFSVDFFKFFVSGVGAGIFILGYVYSFSFFGSFGLALSELGFSVFDIFFRGLNLMHDLRVLACFTFILLVCAALFSSREFISNWFSLVVVFASILLLLFGILKGGSFLGKDHAKNVWASGSGKPVYCDLIKKNDENHEGFASALRRLSSDHRMRMIFTSDDFVYVAPILEEVPAGQTHGEAYAIPKASISYCRIVGS